jgi:hypothetical protein
MNLVMQQNAVCVSAAAAAPEGKLMSAPCILFIAVLQYIWLQLHNMRCLRVPTYPAPLLCFNKSNGSYRPACHLKG